MFSSMVLSRGVQFDGSVTWCSILCVCHVGINSMVLPRGVQFYVSATWCSILWFCHVVFNSMCLPRGDQFYGSATWCSILWFCHVVFNSMPMQSATIERSTNRTIHHSSDPACKIDRYYCTLFIKCRF
jgi:hypothetical protein